jgi:hypothetical protein
MSPAIPFRLARTNNAGNPRNVAGGSKKFAHLPEEARRLRAVGDRLSGVQVVLECVLLPFGALGDRHLGDPEGHPSQDGAAGKQVTFTPDGKQEHLGNS